MHCVPTIILSNKSKKGTPDNSDKPPFYYFVKVGAKNFSLLLKIRINDVNLIL